MPRSLQQTYTVQVDEAQGYLSVSVSPKLSPHIQTFGLCFQTDGLCFQASFVHRDGHMRLDDPVNVSLASLGGEFSTTLATTSLPDWEALLGPQGTPEAYRICRVAEEWLVQFEQARKDWHWNRARLLPQPGRPEVTWVWTPPLRNGEMISYTEHKLSLRWALQSLAAQANPRSDEMLIIAGEGALNHLRSPSDVR